MQVKIIKTTRDIMAICDSDLLGKKFKQGKFQLDLKESFYKGDEKNLEETIKIIQKMIKEDATFNIVGEQSVSAAIKSGIISEKEIKKIQGIPFSLVLI